MKRNLLPIEKTARVLASHHISEKSSRMVQDNQYTFKVVPSASKREIKKAIESYYEVTVVQVRVLNVKAKRKNIGKVGRPQMGCSKNWKKAYITLAKGQSIPTSGSE